MIDMTGNWDMRKILFLIIQSIGDVTLQALMIALPATKNLVDGKIDINGTKTSTCFAYVSISTKTVPFSNLGAFPPSKATPIVLVYIFLLGHILQLLRER